MRPPTIDVKPSKNNMAATASWTHTERARSELARIILQMLKDGQPVAAQDALQLRNWAVGSEDALLPLVDITNNILSRRPDV